MKQIKALILDAGGVMVHPIHGNWDIPALYREILKDRASLFHGPEFLAACAANREYLNEDRSLPTLDEEYHCRYNFLKGVFSYLKADIPEETLIELAEDFSYNPERYRWYPDTDDVLERLHQRYRIGVLSDAMPSFRVVADKHDAGLKHFDAVSISCEVGCAKPNPIMYRDILAKLQMPPENCIFVDDRPCNLEGAAKLGISTVQMCRDGIEEWSGPAVHTLVELETYLEELK